MDGKRNLKLEVEKPIEKPNFPLPMDFNPSMFAEQPTRRRSPQKAHYYRRQTTESGTPIYDFYISDDTRH